MSEFERRDFLKFTTRALLAASGLFGLGALGRFLNFQTQSPPQTVFDLGLASEYAVGTRRVLPEIPALLIHNEDGFSALSLVCTHLGCTVEENTSGFVCPCHGSLYDDAGNSLRGPAGKPLRALTVETTADGQLRLLLN
ncbi:MAG: Rieske (2Fe-2S) protein [Anaerolineae bacterium]|nr:Rieske (2Fe-2S) protein [Anaerolineae bacterium]